MKDETYGHAIVGIGSDCQRKINVIDFVVTEFRGGRRAGCLTLENDEGFILSIENPPESDRSNQQLWLTKDSLVALITSANILLTAHGDSLSDLLVNASNGNDIQYSCSPNLTNILNLKFGI